MRPELFARLSEQYFQNDGERLNIDPHIVSLALQELEDAGHVHEVTEPTRGSRAIKVLRLADPIPGAETAIRTTAGRKRLLYSRYLSWAQGTSRHPQGLIGPAAERAVRTCLVDAAGIGLANRGAAETSTLLGVKLPGPLDAAGYITLFDDDGLPTSTATLLVEVKNLRQWIYPEDAELWQVIRKALAISTVRPGQQIVPLLVCRRAHPSSRWMAKQLGFLIVEMLANFVGDLDDEVKFQEVRNGLGFHDLKLGADPNKHMRKQLSAMLPRQAAATATQWNLTMDMPAMVDIMKQLCTGNPPANARRRLVRALDQCARNHGMQGWRRH